MASCADEIRTDNFG
ncbi:hypothetical protein D018_3453A, partial [Vibrio parahaemolyticus VP2007-007]